MTIKIQTRFHRIATVLVFTGFAACVAWADIQKDKASISAGNNACAGNYTAQAKMTNSTGGTWLTPTANSTNGTFTDLSGFAPPYKSVTVATRRSDGVTWCGTNSITFPATNAASYSLTVYVTRTPPPPTNGQPMNLQVTWH